MKLFTNIDVDVFEGMSQKKVITFMILSVLLIFLLGFLVGSQVGFNSSEKQWKVIFEEYKEQQKSMFPISDSQGDFIEYIPINMSWFEK